MNICKKLQDGHRYTADSEAVNYCITPSTNSAGLNVGLSTINHSHICKFMFLVFIHIYGLYHDSGSFMGVCRISVEGVYIEGIGCNERKGAWSCRDCRGRLTWRGINILSGC